MVPLLEHYAFAAVLLTAVVLHVDLLQRSGRRQPADHGPGSVVHADSGGRRRRAGTGRRAERHARGRRRRRRAGERGLPRAVPGPAGTAGAAAAKHGRQPRGGPWIALRATLIVMPVFVLALSDPSFYMAAVMKTVALGSAGRRDRRALGRPRAGRLDAGRSRDRRGGVVRPVDLAQPLDADPVADRGRSLDRVGDVRRPAHADAARRSGATRWSRRSFCSARRSRTAPAARGCSKAPSCAPASSWGSRSTRGA